MIINNTLILNLLILNHDSSSCRECLNQLAFNKVQGGFMSTTRTKTSISKKLSALTKGAKYGTSSAGVATMGLGALSLFITISNPVSLAIAGGIGTLFCCVGGCYELHKNDNEEPRRNEEVKRENNSALVGSMGMFSLTHERDHMQFYASSPANIEMDDMKESKSQPLRKA
jgi:hypothetical protein